MASKKSKKHSKSPDLTELQDLILEACVVSEELTATSARLETLKDSIRELAVPLIKNGDNNVKLETSRGTCTVSMVQSVMSLVDGVDPDVLKLTLDADMWNTFFVQKPVFRSIAKAAFVSMDDEQRARLGKRCPFELVDRNAQVKLPK